MSEKFAALSDADSLVLDTNVIINFSKVISGGLALNYLTSSYTKTYVTDTVEGEVRDTRELTGYEKSSYLQWAYRSSVTGEVLLKSTGVPSGRNMGEQSIRVLLDQFGHRMGKTIVLTGDSKEGFPGASDVLDSAALTNSLLLTGQISYGC